MSILKWNITCTVSHPTVTCSDQVKPVVVSARRMLLWLYHINNTNNVYSIELHTRQPQDISHKLQGGNLRQNVCHQFFRNNLVTLLQLLVIQSTKRWVESIFSPQWVFFSFNLEVYWLHSCAGTAISMTVMTWHVCLAKLPLACQCVVCTTHSQHTVGRLLFANTPVLDLLSEIPFRVV